jgi:CO dehydrogenase/acetyl-CoA synthase beta subunit
MNAFDPYFARIREYTAALAKSGRTTRVWSAGAPGAYLATVAEASSTVILKEDTGVELGGPGASSSTFILWTDDISFVREGTTTLVGPDIQQTQGEHAPFAQVTLIACPSLGNDAQPALERAIHGAERLPGYMARGTGGRIWSRVSHEALAAGFSLRALGDNIVHQLRRSFPAAIVEMLFVTSSDEDVRQLDTIGAQVRKLSHDLRRERLRATADGAYECESGISCEVCPDNVVCSQIREMIVIRKKATPA